MRFVKPLDEDLVEQLAQEHELLVTVEEGSVWAAPAAPWLNIWPPRA